MSYLSIVSSIYLQHLRVQICIHSGQHARAFQICDSSTFDILPSTIIPLVRCTVSVVLRICINRGLVMVHCFVPSPSRRVTPECRRPTVCLSEHSLGQVGRY